MKQNRYSHKHFKLLRSSIIRFHDQFTVIDIKMFYELFFEAVLLNEKIYTEGNDSYILREDVK